MEKHGMVLVKKSDLVDLIKAQFSAHAALISETSGDVRGDLKELEAEMIEYAKKFGLTEDDF